MSLSRRTLALRLISGAALLGVPRLASAETATYGYDAHGRLISVSFDDGRLIRYIYDEAGNRLLLSRGTTASAFSATITPPTGGPINLRTLADASGYTGETDATIAFEINSGVTIMGLPGAVTLAPSAGGTGGRGIDTGVWPTGTHSITLSLTIKTGAKIYGGGGNGGQAGMPGGSAGAGGPGGDAIYCQAPIAITVQSGAEVRAGGGGGGGGGGWQRNSDSLIWGGGGGGGGYPNGPGNATAQSPDTPGSPGANGTTSGGGAGGAGVTVPGVPSRSTGAGGNGGGVAATGSAGAASSGSTTGFTQIARGLGGAAGYAIRKNGNTVPVSNSGTISGTVG